MRTPTDREPKRARKTARKSKSIAGESAGLGSVGKALAVLEAVTGAREPIPAAEIVGAVGLTRPTAHRICALLVEQGFLERDPVDRGFVEGPRLVKLALTTLTAAGPRGARRKVLETLARETGESALLAALSGADATVIEAVHGPAPLCVHLPAGTRLPLHASAAGQVLLASLPPRDRKRLVEMLPLEPLTARSHGQAAALLAAVEMVARDREAVVDGQFLEGVACAASPVEAGGRVYGTISIAGPSFRLTPERARAMLPAVRAAATQIARSFEASR